MSGGVTRPFVPQLAFPYATYGFLTTLTLAFLVAPASTDGFARWALVVGAAVGLVFGLIGLLYTHAQRRGGGLVSLVGMTAMMSTLVGLLVSTAFVWMTFYFGGAILVFFIPMMALYVAAGVAVVSLPAFVFIHVAAARVGRAVHGSIVDASDRRSLWRPTLATPLLLSLASVLREALRPAGLVAIDAACALVFLGLIIADLRARRAILAFPVSPAPLPKSNDVFERLLGHPLTARRVIANALFFDLVALTIAIGAFAFHGRQCGGYGADQCSPRRIIAAFST